MERNLKSEKSSPLTPQSLTSHMSGLLKIMRKVYTGKSFANDVNHMRKRDSHR